MAPSPSRLTRANLGFRLAKAAQRWNEILYERFCAAGFSQVRPSFGSILIPLFEEDGLRLGDLARRGGIAKQTMTTMVRHVEKAGLVRCKADPEDARAARVHLTEAARRFAPVAERILEEMEREAARVSNGREMQQVGHWLKRFAEK
jgi:DNA-binding MarR family transcriptional regulator